MRLSTFPVVSDIVGSMGYSQVECKARRRRWRVRTLLGKTVFGVFDLTLSGP